MKPLADASAEKQPPGVTARRSDESFNFDDLSAQEEPTAQAEESREPREAKQEQPAARSPSPSALSTASSASPLIRSDSSSSSSSSSSTTARGQTGKQSAATGWRPLQQTGGGAVGGPRRAHHLAPTSIAVAQLQQQQQRQQLATQQQQQQEKSKSSPKMSKFSSGNKLAQMAAAQQQVSECADKKTKTKKKHENELGHHEGKSFGYNLGKMMAHRAGRFNEFWSVNKMRYMNLACLLMTLVCLLTILLFSKSGGGGGNQSLDAAASQPQRSKQHHAYAAPPPPHQRHRFAATAGNGEQPTMGGEDEQERPLESIDSIDRQPFVRSASSRKHALTMTMSDDDDELPAADSTTTSASDTADGFNLFDETDSAAANGKRSLDDLLQDARRQLKRQQENEREADGESTTTTPSSQTQATTEQPADDDKLQRKLAPINPLLSRALGDLDGFGLFKSIKSQLLEQLNQAPGNGTGSERDLFAAGKPIVRRGKNGATIIMSFGGSLSADDNPVNGSVAATNATSEQSQPTASLGSALERLLLPPPLAAILSGAKLPGGAQGGFARITINAPEPTIFRSSSSSSLANPFEGPPPLFARSFPFMPYESPMQSRVFTLAGDSAPSPSSSTGAGGFMSMILRASSDLARQMDKQLSSSSSSSSSSRAANASVVANKTSAQTEQLKPEASQQVRVTSAGGAANETTTTTTTTTTTKDDDAEVETFDVSRMMLGGAEPRLSPVSPVFHSLYSGARALRPPPPLIMIGGGGDSPFGLMPPPLSSAGSMIMMGASGGGGGNPRGPPQPLSLGSILSDVMATMAREARGAAAGRRGDPDMDTPTSSGPDDEDSSSSSSSWDEQPASSRIKMSRHHSPPDTPDATVDSEREESEPTAARNIRRSSSSGSLLEHLLNGGGGPPHTATRRVFGTIRQTFRGPDGVTVERVIDMPPARAHVGRHFEMHSVPAGVRSQSISSRADDGSERQSSQDRAPAFARMMRELSDSSSSPFSGPRPFFSRASASPLFAAGGLFGREPDSHDASDDETSSQAAARVDSQPSERSEDQVELVPGHWHSEVKRVHIAAGPRVSDQFPRHFSLPADERSQHVSGQLEKSNDEGAPTSSPSSPLFGFPALKPTFKSPQVVAGVTEPLTAAAAAARTTSQRQPRAFVYHSNHEVATRQRPDPARARSAERSEANAPIAPASASMVMGRRLDDFVDQRR